MAKEIFPSKKYAIKMMVIRIIISVLIILFFLYSIMFLIFPKAFFLLTNYPSAFFGSNEFVKIVYYSVIFALVAAFSINFFIINLLMKNKISIIFDSNGITSKCGYYSGFLNWNELIKIKKTGFPLKLKKLKNGTIYVLYIFDLKDLENEIENFKKSLINL